jgi:hypothetical protein
MCCQSVCDKLCHIPTTTLPRRDHSSTHSPLGGGMWNPSLFAIISFNQLTVDRRSHRVSTVCALMRTDTSRGQACHAWKTIQWKLLNSYARDSAVNRRRILCVSESKKQLPPLLVRGSSGMVCGCSGCMGAYAWPIMMLHSFTCHCLRLPAMPRLPRSVNRPGCFLGWLAPG